MSSTSVTLYPIYFDKQKSWNDGRRVPKDLSVENPAAVFIAETAGRLGYQVTLEQERRHPADPLTFGRIKVEGIHIKKTELIRQIAEKLPETTELMKAADPHVAAFASSSRSELSKNIMEKVEKDGGKKGKKNKK
jgi:signal recognition particle subunit SEC65